jgi:hypothetical protein
MMMANTLKMTQKTVSMMTLAHGVVVVVKVTTMGRHADIATEQA